MTAILATKPALPTGSAAQPSTTPPSPTSGADIVVQSLVNHGVDTIFAYPGGASMPLAPGPDAVPRPDPRRSCRGTSKAAGSPPRATPARTGKIGVCMATSGPGATNLVTAIADAKLDSIPMLAITGQVRHRR